MIYLFHGFDWVHTTERRSKTVLVTLVRSERRGFAWLPRKPRTRWHLHKEDLKSFERSSWSWRLWNWTLLWCIDQRLEDSWGHFRASDFVFSLVVICRYEQSCRNVVLVYPVQLLILQSTIIFRYASRVTVVALADVTCKASFLDCLRTQWGSGFILTWSQPAARIQAAVMGFRGSLPKRFLAEGEGDGGCDGSPFCIEMVCRRLCDVAAALSAAQISGAPLRTTGSTGTQSTAASSGPPSQGCSGCSGWTCFQFAVCYIETNAELQIGLECLDDTLPTGMICHDSVWCLGSFDSCEGALGA